jgi:hypothetical protein
VGRYAIGFQHRALAVLGIESPIEAFELGTDSVVQLNLVVPSGAALRELVCGASEVKARDGVIAGLLLAARSDVPVRGATIVARWTEVGMVGGKIGPAQHERSATAAEDGTYHLCDVPSDAMVSVDVRAPGHRGIQGELWIPVASVVRRDFHLADSSIARGAAVLLGRVLQDDGSGVGTGRVSIPALGIFAEVRDGAFSLAQLPAGTWSAEIRSIGYEPLNALVDVGEHGSVPARITLAKEAQKLEAVNVVGKAGHEVKVLSEIHQRSLTSAGTQFLPGNSWLKAAFDPGDVLRGARGFNIKSATRAEARLYFDDHGNQKTCATRTLTPDLSRTGGMDGNKEVAVYIDGLRAPGGLEQLNDELRMDQVLAMETYPDMASVPLIWRNSRTCAVIAVWTKR